MNVVALLTAALIVTPGTPNEGSSEDFDHGCYLGHWEGSESRLVYEGAPEAPFHVGTPGEGLEAEGMVSLSAGPRGRGDVTVQFAQTYQATEAWEAFADDDSAVIVVAGQFFTVGECGDGACRVTVDGRDLWASEDSWEGDLLPTPPSDEVGWWVPVVREGVTGWVRGVGFVIEVRCVGPDEGADMRQAKWH
jgi:hypothetical protein